MCVCRSYNNITQLLKYLATLCDAEAGVPFDPSQLLCLKIANTYKFIFPVAIAPAVEYRRCSVCTYLRVHPLMTLVSLRILDSRGHGACTRVSCV